MSSTEPAPPGTTDRPHHVDVYVDPSCPWSWVASRWLTEVRDAHGISMTWRSFSLLLRDGDRPPPGMPQEIAAIALATARQSLRLLRVFEALRHDGDEAAIDRLYTAWGRRVFVPGPPTAPKPGLLTDLVRACGRGAAADDPAWDEPITRSMRTATTLLGRPPVTPTIVLTGRETVAYAGPVLSAAITGTAATRLWDALQTVATEPAFHALHRSQPPFPTFPTPTGENP